MGMLQHHQSFAHRAAIPPLRRLPCVAAPPVREGLQHAASRRPFLGLLRAAPDPDGMVVARRGEQRGELGVPTHSVHCAGVAFEHLQQRALRPVPDVHLRVFGSAHHERQVAAPEAGPHHVPPLPFQLGAVPHGRGGRHVAFLKLGEVPEVDALVLQVDEQLLAVGGEAERDDVLGLREQVLRLQARVVQVVHAEPLLVARGEEPLPVAADLEVVDAVPGGLEERVGLALRRPHVHGFVQAPGDEPAAAGQPRTGRDVVLVFVRFEPAVPVRGVPQPDGAVVAARHEGEVVRRPRQEGDAVPVPFQLVLHLPAAVVGAPHHPPDDGGAVRRSRGQPLPAVRELQVPHFVRVGVQHLQDPGGDAPLVALVVHEEGERGVPAVVVHAPVDLQLEGLVQQPVQAPLGHHHGGRDDPLQLAHQQGPRALHGARPAGLAPQLLGAAAQHARRQHVHALRLPLAEPQPRHLHAQAVQAGVQLPALQAL
mmetsp:Transcript_7311/g.20797  ORF Transcript_7311/g.20797 Transcript_7311/m.20797 type:complete len:482 (+) Transcript_7311:218-1663(+)